MITINSLIYGPIIFGILKILFRKRTLNIFINEIFILSFIALYSLIQIQQNSLDIHNINLILESPWLIDVIGLKYSLKIDGLAFSMLGLTWLVMLVVSCYLVTKKVEPKQSILSGLFFIMYGLINGSFLANNTLLFFIYFEAMTIPLFIIIGVWGSDDRVYATIKFMLYTLVGSIFLLISFLFLSYLTKNQFPEVVDIFAIDNLYKLSIPIGTQKYLFWTLIVSFMIKIPMLPVHTWLPNAHVQAPTLGSVILAAITLKIGGYGILRFVLPVVPDAANYYADIMIWLSAFTIVYVAIIAISQQNVKKIIAYSSISHMGFVTLSLFLIFKIDDPSIRILSLQGSIIVMISHGFVSSGLFLMVGKLIDIFKTKDITMMSQVVKYMPTFSLISLSILLANSALPGTSSFIGEFLVILASAATDNYYLLALVVSSVLLGAAYSLYIYKKVFWNTIDKAKQHHNEIDFKDINKMEILSYSILIFMILWLGLNPNYFIDIIHPSIEQILTTIFR